MSTGRNHSSSGQTYPYINRFGGAGGGAPVPRGAIGAVGGLVLLVGGAWVFNNALFNGMATSMVETDY